MAKTDLFVTFTGLLWLLDEGLVESEQLDRGLFAMGCTREYVFDGHALEDENLWVLRDKHKLQVIMVEILQPGIAKAEGEGRLVWRADDMPYMTMGRINQLLAANLHRTFPDTSYDQYHTYPDLEELAAVQLPEIEVVWERSQKARLQRTRKGLLATKTNPISNERLLTVNGRK